MRRGPVGSYTHADSRLRPPEATRHNTPTPPCIRRNLFNTSRGGRKSMRPGRETPPRPVRHQYQRKRRGPAERRPGGRTDVPASGQSAAVGYDRAAAEAEAACIGRAILRDPPRAVPHCQTLDSRPPAQRTASHADDKDDVCVCTRAGDYSEDAG